MADFYSSKQATASRLLAKFNQGAIIYTPTVQPANEWESVADGTPVTLDAVATGPSKQYLSDLITTSDIEITASVFGSAPEMSGRISIDGVNKQIIAIKQIPASGTPVCWKIWVKG